MRTRTQRGAGAVHQDTSRAPPPRQRHRTQEPERTRTHRFGRRVARTATGAIAGSTGSGCTGITDALRRPGAKGHENRSAFFARTTSSARQAGGLLRDDATASERVPAPIQVRALRICCSWQQGSLLLRLEAGRLQALRPAICCACRSISEWFNPIESCIFKQYFQGATMPKRTVKRRLSWLPALTRPSQR